MITILSIEKHANQEKINASSQHLIGRNIDISIVFYRKPR
jgi:predicted DNA-binding protein with PD1-like motif